MNAPLLVLSGILETCPIAPSVMVEGNNQMMDDKSNKATVFDVPQQNNPSAQVDNRPQEITSEDAFQIIDNVVEMFAGAHKTPLCPVCGREAQFVTGRKDRGVQHPDIVTARYSCGLHGHIIAGPIVDIGLSGTVYDPSLEVAARRAWFTMMNEIMKPTAASNDSDIIPVLQDWVGRITRRQQGVLVLALRGPDGMYKEHPSKNLIRSMRACVMNSGIEGTPMELGKWYPHDTFMRMDLLADIVRWEQEAVKPFFSRIDEYNIHFYQHLLHAAAVLGFHHPNLEVRSHWLRFYKKGCSKLHMTPETKDEFTYRLRDGDRGIEAE